jgi:hypothetical protein
MTADSHHGLVPVIAVNHFALRTGRRETMHSRNLHERFWSLRRAPTGATIPRTQRGSRVNIAVRESSSEKGWLGALVDGLSR